MKLHCQQNILPMGRRFPNIPDDICENAPVTNNLNLLVNSPLFQFTARVLTLIPKTNSWQIILGRSYFPSRVWNRKGKNRKFRSKTESGRIGTEIANRKFRCNFRIGRQKKSPFFRSEIRKRKFSIFESCSRARRTVGHMLISAKNITGFYRR